MNSLAKINISMLSEQSQEELELIINGCRSMMLKWE